MTVRVLLIDDHAVVLDGLAAAMAHEDGLTVVGRAGSVAQARTILAGGDIDVVLVDIRLPDGSGLELLGETDAAIGGPAWIVLSSFETPQYVATALRLGAAGYLLKTAPSLELVEAVRRAAVGGSAFTREQLRMARESGAVRLSVLDRRIVEGLVAGRTNDEIAHDVGVARKTVESHLTRFFELFEVRSRTELALRAEREGWLDLPG